MLASPTMRLRPISSLLLFTATIVAPVALGGVGCGPENPTPATPPPVASSGSAKPAMIAEDRSPVEAPPGLVASLHLTSPKALVKALKSWVPGKLGADELDPRMLVPAMLSARAVDRVVDIDKPIDMTVQVTEGNTKARPRIAIAFGIEDDVDFATALKDTYRIEVISGGVRRLVPTSPAARNESCVIVPALGAAKRRLVCSISHEHDAHSTDVLGPWLARGVTQKPETAPIHGELDVAALRKAFATDWQKAHDFIKGELASESKLGHPELDKVIKKTARAVVDDVFDFLEDLDGVTMDAQLPETGPLVTTSATFSTQKAWLSKAFLIGAEINSKVPEAFGKLPAAGAWLALFSRGTPAADALGVPYQTALLEFVEAAAVDFKWAKKDKELALEVVRLLFQKSSDGYAVVGDGGKSDLKIDKSDLPYEIRDLLPALSRKSWSVGFGDRDGKPVVELYQKLTEFLGRPVFTDLVRELTKDHFSVKVKVDQKAPKDLPKGAFARALDFEIGQVEGTGKKAKVKPITHLGYSLIVVPEGNHTWSSGATNLALVDLWPHLKGAMDGSGSPKVGALGGFDVATKGTPSSGGIMMFDAPLRSLDKKEKVEEMLQKLPDGGKGPLAWRSTATKGPKQVCEVTVQVPRDFIALGAFVMRKF